MCKKYRQILAVSKHEIINQLKNIYYWLIIVIPLILMISAIKYINIKINIHDIDVNHIWAIIIPILTLLFCMLYSSMTSNAVARDKTSKLSEMLLSIVDAREQIFGKILSIYTLAIFHILIYIIFVLTFAHFFNNSFLIVMVHNTSPAFLCYATISFMASLFMSLAITMSFACYITDSTQISVANIPALLLMSTVAFASIYLYMPGEWDSIIYIIYFMCIVPPVGSMLTPVLLLAHSISYPTGYLLICIQSFFMIFLFMKSMNGYKSGLFSVKKKNIFVEGFTIK